MNLKKLLLTMFVTLCSVATWAVTMPTRANFEEALRNVPGVAFGSKDAVTGFTSVKALVNQTGVGANELQYAIEDGVLVIKTGASSIDMPANSQGLFKNLTQVTSIDLTHFNSATVTSMEQFFDNCSALITINFGTSFSTANVTTMRRMFRDCKKLNALDLSSWNVTNVVHIEEMFRRCYALKTLKMPTTKNQKTSNWEYLFKDCISLESVDLSFLYCNQNTVITATDIFGGASKLVEITAPVIYNETLSLPLPAWGTNEEQWYQTNVKGELLGVATTAMSKATNYKTFHYGRKAVYVKPDFAALGLQLWNSTLEKIYVETNTGSELISYSRHSSGALLVTTSEDKVYLPADAAKLFNYANLNYIDMDKFCAADVRRIDQMFDGCANLEELDLSNFELYPDNVTAEAKVAYFLRGTTSLAKIHTPKNFGVPYTIVLPNSGIDGKFWHQTNNDGEAINDICYSRLTEAPVDATLELLPVSRTLGSESLTISAARYAAYAPQINVIIPASAALKVFYVDRYTSDEIHFVQLAAGDIVIAGEGLLVNGDPTTYTFNEAPSAVALEGNKLVGTLAPHHFENAAEAYVLANKGGNIGYYYNSANSTMPAGKSYLPITSAASAAPRLVFQMVAEPEESENTDVATSVENVLVRPVVEGIFTITGQRVNEISTPGFYIVNGEKLIVK